jgi:hypothetical protein
VADEDPRLAHARETLRRRRDELMSTYAAVGAGVGAGKDGDYAIVVYLDDAPQQVPHGASVDGVPLRFEVTGRPRVQG